MEGGNENRTDRATRLIKASPRDIYNAYMDPKALVSWLPPTGMTGRIEVFEPWEGGAYKMVLTYEALDHAAQGKTSENADMVEGRFVKLVRDQCIAQSVSFASDDPAFSGEMIVTWTLKSVPGGTEVSIVCENVPYGIRQEDHDEGLKSSLDNLAAFVE